MRSSFLGGSVKFTTGGMSSCERAPKPGFPIIESKLHAMSLSSTANCAGVEEFIGAVAKLVPRDRVLPLWWHVNDSSLTPETPSL